MFRAFLAGLLTVGLAAQYHVHPDDTPCLQPPCHTLEYFTNNSDEYFVSDTTLFFGQGGYYHAERNIIVKNVVNVSFIGKLNSINYASPVSVIRCLSDSLMYFHNVTNLLINYLQFKECGCLIPKINKETFTNLVSYQDYHNNTWAAMFFQYCVNIDIINTNIYNPVGYGIVDFNAMGNNTFKNMVIIYDQQKYCNNLCNHGLQLLCRSKSALISNGKITIDINNVLLVDNCRPCVHSCTKRMLEIVLNYIGASIGIRNSNFSNIKGNSIIKMCINSSSNISIYFYNCNFISNSVTNELIGVQYYGFKTPFLINHLNVTFHNNTFSHSNYQDCGEKSDPFLLKFNLLSKSPQTKLFIKFYNATFYDNQLRLLMVTAPLDFFPLLNYQSSVSLYTEGYFNVEKNKAGFQQKYSLILVRNGQIHLNGTTKFINNTVRIVLYLESSKLYLSNNVLFESNICYRLIARWWEPYYIVLHRSANVTFCNNEIHDQLIRVREMINHPYPYCIFQYYSIVNSRDRNFQINMLFNKEKAVPPYERSIYRLTSHCRWIPNADFRNETPSAVNRKIITLKYRKSQYSYLPGDHTKICYCSNLSHYNCSIDYFERKIYPGENVSVDLCLPYNNKTIGVMYVESYNRDLPNSACKMFDCSNMVTIFNGNKSTSVHFPIASSEPVMCELFLTATPNLFTSYDTFYVRLLPCPLGFTLQNGICDCDPDLRDYIDDCMISSQTVRLLPNVYITGVDSSTKQYNIYTDCPTHYCRQGTTWINLKEPAADTQCQPHRTGLLCSQCVEGYSVVFGSNRCRKCSNLHLFYIIYIAFIGLFLTMILFILNFTVTSGAINGLILYVNMVWIISQFFLSQLEIFFYSYIKTANIGPSFEMCFYNGMSEYAKLWIQLLYPIYLIVIAVLLIIGSRYSTKLYQLTHNRALPVLATLLMLTYSKMLQSIASVPLYTTTIITIPGHSSKNLWLHDPTIPLLGWKFLLLICVCLLLFLFMLMFNAILLFTRPLMRFKIIHQFKPLIDAFQGPFKSQYYYWVGIHLLIRNIMVLLSELKRPVSLTLCCIVIVTVIAIQGYIRPYKNKLINIQELILLYNFSILCVLLMFNGNETLNIITVNVMVGLSFLHFLIILVYHVFNFVIVTHCTRLNITVTTVWNSIIKKYRSRNKREMYNKNYATEIPEAQYNFANFREPLIGED